MNSCSFRHLVKVCAYLALIFLNLTVLSAERLYVVLDDATLKYDDLATDVVSFQTHDRGFSGFISGDIAHDGTSFYIGDPEDSAGPIYISTDMSTMDDQLNIGFGFNKLLVAIYKGNKSLIYSTYREIYAINLANKEQQIVIDQISNSNEILNIAVNHDAGIAYIALAGASGMFLNLNTGSFGLLNLDLGSGNKYFAYLNNKLYVNLSMDGILKVYDVNGALLSNERTLLPFSQFGSFLGLEAFNHIISPINVDYLYAMTADQQHLYRIVVAEGYTPALEQVYSSGSVKIDEFRVLNLDFGSSGGGSGGDSGGGGGNTGGGSGGSGDECPDDPTKTAPGDCGCGVLDLDSDEDGVSDCKDECPDQSTSSVKDAVCGCTGAYDSFLDECILYDDKTRSDNDGDLVPDDEDQCPRDSLVSKKGECACGAYPDLDNICQLNPIFSPEIDLPKAVLALDDKLTLFIDYNIPEIFPNTSGEEISLAALKSKKKSKKKSGKKKNDSPSKEYRIIKKIDLSAVSLQGGIAKTVYKKKLVDTNAKRNVLTTRIKGIKNPTNTLVIVRYTVHQQERNSSKSKWKTTGSTNPSDAAVIRAPSSIAKR